MKTPYERLKCAAESYRRLHMSNESARELLSEMQRLRDLVRYQRADLLGEKLITIDEYRIITGWGRGSARRLEGYDALSVQLSQAKERIYNLELKLKVCNDNRRR